MEKLQTNSFDELLKSKISHLSNYPEMLPFIGYNWDNSQKILLIGESHYLPFDEVSEYSDFDYNEKWYDGNSSILNASHKSYITTRNNILKVESGKYESPLAMYFNLKSALLECPQFKNSQMVFDNFSYYNYFQKPAAVQETENEDRSIVPSEQDNKIAHLTFKKILEIIEPKRVIFVSKKSYDAFIKEQEKSSNDGISNIAIDFVPHAGRQWWNREAGVYGNRTGKQKFIDLING